VDQDQGWGVDPGTGLQPPRTSHPDPGAPQPKAPMLREGDVANGPSPWWRRVIFQGPPGTCHHRGPAVEPPSSSSSQPPSSQPLQSAPVLPAPPVSPSSQPGNGQTPGSPGWSRAGYCILVMVSLLRVPFWRPSLASAGPQSNRHNKTKSLHQSANWREECEQRAVCRNRKQGDRRYEGTTNLKLNKVVQIFLWQSPSCRKGKLSSLAPIRSALRWQGGGETLEHHTTRRHSTIQR